MGSATAATEMAAIRSFRSHSRRQTRASPRPGTHASIDEDVSPATYRISGDLGNMVTADDMAGSDEGPALPAPDQSILMCCASLSAGVCSTPSPKSKRTFSIFPVKANGSLYVKSMGEPTS